LHQFLSPLSLERMRMEEVLKQNSSDTWGARSSTIGMANRIAVVCSYFGHRWADGGWNAEESVQLSIL
jgi:hypothetical protein